MKIKFTSFPAKSKAVKESFPIFWSTLSLNEEYEVISDYEKVIEGTSHHFFMIEDSDGALVEVPLYEGISIVPEMKML